MKQFFFILFAFLLCNTALGDMLNGGKKARAEAYREAQRHKLTFVSSSEVLTELLSKNHLVPLVSETNFIVDKQVSYPFAVPEARILAQRLSEYLNEVCDERMVITSALRLTTQKLKNSVNDTVHPAGIALDIRRPPRKCRKWFEARIMYLEHKGLIQATRERWPAHYHVVVYPEQYASYIAETARQDLALYEVRNGDTLSSIASRFGTTITELVIINGLESPDFLRIGDKIRLR